MSVHSVQLHPSTPSQTSLAHSGTTHTHTSVSTSSPLVERLALESIEKSSSKVSRGGSLSLIGSARVRLAKDVSARVHALLKPKYAVPNTCWLPLLLQFRALIRTQSNSSSLDDARYSPAQPDKVRRQRPATPLTTVPDCAQAEPSDARALVLSSHVPYLSRQPSQSDTELESMQESHEERKGRWAFGAKVSDRPPPGSSVPCAQSIIRVIDASYILLLQLVGFLNRSRSRSRSKKRRSRSLENIAPPVSEMPQPFQGGSLGRRNPYTAPLEGTDASTSTSSASGSKPYTRSPSRPLSGATDATVKARTKKVGQSPSNTQDMPPRHHVHLQADVLATTTTDPSRKAKKTNFFSMAITNQRRCDQPDESDNRERGAASPSNGSRPSPRRWGRFRSGSGSSAGSSRSNVGDRDRVAETPPPVPPKPGSSRPPRALHVIPPERSATYNSLNSPPPPYRLDEYEYADQEQDLAGRCSPLCGIPSPRLTPVGPTFKGKERERVGSPAEHARERDNRPEKKKRVELEITHPRRVGSPQARGRESRNGAIGHPIEKVASGSGSGKSSTKDSAASAALRTKQTKHGSFDFERPVSAMGGALHMRTALRGTAGVSFDGPALQRSRSAKEVPLRSQAPPSSRHVQSSSVGRTASRPAPEHYPPQMSRQPTENSQAGSASSGGRSYFNYGDSAPISPTSSNSGHSSSWGRRAGTRLQGGTLGPFKFEPAVPPIPGSPASDERVRRVEDELVGQPSPTKARPTRPPTKGRSLDLGLSLSWAPQKVREEALLPYGASGGSSATTSRMKSRWRTAKVDEQGRLESSPVASDLARQFKEALGDAAYKTFKTCEFRL